MKIFKRKFMLHWYTPRDFIGLTDQRFIQSFYLGITNIGIYFELPKYEFIFKNTERAILRSLIHVQGK